MNSPSTNFGIEGAPLFITIFCHIGKTLLLKFKAKKTIRDDEVLIIF